MRRLLHLAVLAVAAAGCAGASPERVGVVRDISELPPGYAVMVATFQYVPGASTFPASQVVNDTYYVTERLSALGYQSIMAARDEHYIRVGLRVSSFALARSLKKQIDMKLVIDLGDGNKLRVPETKIINLAELKVTSPHQVK